MSLVDLSSIDVSTAALIIQSQLDDLEEITTRRKGKLREDVVSDADIALQLYHEDLKRLDIFMTDRAMTQSIAAAVVTDGPALTACEEQERIATQDHETARRMGGLDAYTDGVPIFDFDDLTDDTLHKLRHLYVSPVDVDGELEPSSSREGGKGESSQQYIECEVCSEMKLFFDLAELPCGHKYCRGCLQQLFEASIIDETLFPPRCCRQPIIIKQIRPFITTEVVKRFVVRKRELETANRTYCSSPTCSVFIHPNQIEDDRATCTQCGTITCSTCKSASHEGDCPNDTALQDLLRLADENGWRRCFKCRRMVELDVGCNHMTCHCGAQFCYRCGERWKICSCDQWDENRLITRANQIVDRRHVTHAQDRARQVEAAVEHLRNNHNCTHETWRYVRGMHACEECRHQLPAYIFRCRQCGIQVCHRCRRNRL